MDDFLRKQLLQLSYKPHASSVQQYNRCRRKWALHQLYEPEQEHKALHFGTVFHAMLEAYHRGIEWEGHPEMEFLEEEDHELLRSMFDYYTKYWLEAPENAYYKNLEYLEHELEFSLRISPTLSADYAGRIDAIVKDEYGRLWVLDYKTRSQLTGESGFDTDFQMSVYALAGRQLGFEVEGVIVLQFLKKPAKGLRKLKNGTFSTAKNQRVSPLIVREQLQEVPEEERDALASFAMYDPDQDPFVRAVQTHRTPMQLTNTRRYLGDHYKEYVLLLDRYTSFTPNFTRDCTWDCPFRAVCMAYEDGFDWRQILEGNFKRKEAADDGD